MMYAVRLNYFEHRHAHALYKQWHMHVSHASSSLLKGTMIDIQLTGD